MSREHVQVKATVAASNYDSVKLTADVLDSRVVTEAIASLAEALALAAAVKHYEADPQMAWLAETERDIESYVRDVFTGFELPSIGERLAADFTNAFEEAPHE